MASYCIFMLYTPVQDSDSTRLPLALCCAKDSDPCGHTLRGHSAILLVWYMLGITWPPAHADSCLQADNNGRTLRDTIFKKFLIFNPTFTGDHLVREWRHSCVELKKKVQDTFQCNNDGLLLQTKKQKYNLSHFHLWFLWDINHSKTYIQIQNNWSETPQNKYKMQWKQQQTTAPRNTCKIN